MFDYRIIKTHKHNPRIGDRTFKLTKQRTEKGKKITIDAVKEYSGSDLQKLLMITHKHSRLAVEYIGELFAIGHAEVQKIILEPDKPLLVTPDIKTILQFQKISKPRNNKRN